MKEKKWNFCALGLGILLFAIKLISMIAQMRTDPAMDYVVPTFSDRFASLAAALMPLLLVLIIACLLVGNKEKTFGGKWGGFAISFFCLLCANELRELLLLIEFWIRGGFYLLSLLRSVIASAGFVVLILSLLNKKFEKLMMFGPGALALSLLLEIADRIVVNYTFGEILATPHLYMLAAFVLMTLLFAKVLPDGAAKLIRNVAVALLLLAALLGMDTYSLFFVLAGLIGWLALVYFQVPGKFKMPKTLSFFVAILYAVFAVIGLFEILTWIRLGDYYETLYRFITIVGLVLLCIGFTVKKLERLNLFGFGALALAVAMEMFYFVRMAPYGRSVLEIFIYNTGAVALLFTSATAMLAAMLLCMAIADNRAAKNATKLRNWAIVCVVTAAFLGATEIGREMVYVWTMGNSGYMSTYAPEAYLIFALVTVLAVFAMVPLCYKMEQSIGKFLFLTVITFGVWYLIWIYNVTKHLNTVDGLEQRKPIKELLLCMFLPLYAVYWHYKAAKLTDAYAKNEGTKLEILSLVFGLLAPAVSAVLIQDKLNHILASE